MDGPGTVLSLQEFIASLDHASLPRILQVCSGVYFQGSVYELSGSEVCLSTGDLVKVIGLKLQSASCVDIATNSTYELPIDHKGLFNMVAEDMPYSSLEEIVGLLPVGVDTIGTFSFVSCSEFTIDNFTVAAGQVLTVLSSEADCVRCQVVGSEASTAEIRVPLKYYGTFYECQTKHGYSLQEILSSSRLRCRRFRSFKAKACGGPLIFTPIYQIQAIMHMRKNVVSFPSSLEVDVVDVTNDSLNVEFVKPLTLTEVSSQPSDSFPTVAEVLEAPEGSRNFFNCDWHSQLQQGQRLVLHGHRKSNMVLASTPKGRKAQQYFIIRGNYSGRLRRKAREFGTVYELSVAACRVGAGELRVSVTRNCEAVEEEGLPELDIGDQLEVLACERIELPAIGEDGRKQSVEALKCKCIVEDEEEEDDVEEDEDGERQSKSSREDIIHLPLYMSAQFVEVLTDKKKYTMAELLKDFLLPLDVKVVSQDSNLEKDPLSGQPALRLEESLVEPTVLASLLERPERCFELPTQWLQMSVSFTSETLPWPKDQCPKLSQETVTEVKEHFYYEFRKLTNTDATPPPRPPKRKTSVGKPRKPAKGNLQTAAPAKNRSLSSSFCQLSVGSENKSKRSPAPLPPMNPDDIPPPIISRKPKESGASLSLANTYVRAPAKGRAKSRNKSDSDHDYESVEETVRNAQESIMYY